MTASSDLRRLTFAGVAGGFALSSEVGWNQSEADWRLLLRAGDGIGIGDDGRLVATAIILPLGARIGWIAMVLVALTQRMRGYATRMMDWAVAHCRAAGLVAALDATPAGREVYRRLGFADGPRILRLRALDIAEILDLDRRGFGGDRALVLRELARRTPALALACRRAGRVVGYALGRVGRVAHEIGPIVAADDAAALALLRAACAKAGQAPVIVDALEARHGCVDALLAAGWAEQRSYTRMAIGSLPIIGAPEIVFTIAGPEYA